MILDGSEFVIPEPEKLAISSVVPLVKFDGIRDGEWRRIEVVRCSCCTGKCDEVEENAPPHVSDR